MGVDRAFWRMAMMAEDRMESAQDARRDSERLSGTGLQ